MQRGVLDEKTDKCPTIDYISIFFNSMWRE